LHGMIARNKWLVHDDAGPEMLSSGQLSAKIALRGPP